MPVYASILTPLYTAFSWCMQNLYLIFFNFGLAIIVFTVAIRAILIPLSVKQYKTMLRTQALAPQVDDLKRIYGKDRQGLQMATMELYKKHHISQVGGCLPSLMSLLIIWPVYRIVSSPLQYIAGVSQENLAKLADYLQGLGRISASQLSGINVTDLPLLHALHNDPQSFAHAVNQGWLQAKDLVQLNFLGIDLGVYPSIAPSKLFSAEWTTYLPVLFVVVLAVATTFLTSKVTEWTNPMFFKLKEDKERAKVNRAKTEPTDMMQQGTMKSMRYMMPAMTLIFSFQMPVAMALYWVAGNLMMILQQMILYWLYAQNYRKRLLPPVK